MQLRKINKKGQIGGLAKSVIALGVAAIILVLMIVILQEFRDIPIVKSSESSGTINNETTPTLVNDTAFSGQFTGSVGAFGPTCSVTGVTGVGNSTLISNSNYTVSGCQIKSTILADGSNQVYNNSLWNVTYSFTSGGESYRGANQTVVGLGTFADFWTIIVLAIIAAIVIGIIFGAFGGLTGRNR